METIRKYLERSKEMEKTSYVKAKLDAQSILSLALPRTLGASQGHSGCGCGGDIQGPGGEPWP